MNKSKVNHKNYLKYKVNRAKFVDKTYARVVDTERGLVFFPGIGMTFKDFLNIK